MGITKQQNGLECDERARGGERPNDNKTQPTTFRVFFCVVIVIVAQCIQDVEA